MISKQKILQWIEDKKYVYSGPYSDNWEAKRCIGSLNILSMMERDIELGEFVVDNGEEVKE